MISYSSVTVTAWIGVCHSYALCPTFMETVRKEEKKPKPFKIAKPKGEADLPVASVLEKIQVRLHFLSVFEKLILGLR